MININLSNNAYKWTETKEGYSIGYAFKEEELIKGKKLIDLFSKCNEYDDYKNIVQKLNGIFTIIIKKNDKIYVISDIQRRFPLFYTYLDGFLLTDNLDNIKTKEIDEELEKEFLYSGYIIGNKTLYRNIYQTQNSEILELKENDYNTSRYFDFDYDLNAEIKDYNKLDKIYDNAIKKTIKLLNGKTAVVPLSGGHDSRLIIYYLVRNNYKNIITYTYGQKNNEDARISKKVAEYFNLKWIFVPYKNKAMQKLFYNKEEYSKMADFCSRAYSVTHIQEWMAVKYLKSNYLIPEDSIFIPGFSGDFLAGTHIKDIFLGKELRQGQLTEAIINSNYHLCKMNEPEKNKMKEKLKSILTNELDDIVDVTKACNFFEKFDFNERQTKFITNSNKTYEQFGYQSINPLWDINIINFWLQMPLKDRYERRYYLKFVNYLYDDLNEFAPPTVHKKIKKYKSKIMNNIQKIYKIFYLYNKHFLNYYGYFKFSDYLKMVVKYKSVNYYFMLSLKYLEYLKSKE